MPDSESTALIPAHGFTMDISFDIPGKVWRYFEESIRKYV